ncbi:MAG: pyridoxamine 5'-phosphate oxidase family protein [Thermoleophilaceae bacterium]
MTASLPDPVTDVFARYITTEYTTVDRRGAPITWPVTPYYASGGEHIDVTTGLGYPKKANDARANPKVGLLFSDPTGSGLEGAPMVLVQGCAGVDDADLDSNRERYWEESAAKLPATKDMHPPALLRGLFAWYYTRIYVHVRPERVFVWPEGDVTREPELYDSHLEEVRSGHDEEPDVELPPPAGGAIAWDGRIEELGRTYTEAVLSLVSPDGFPFSVRVPVTLDRAARRVRIEADPAGMPLQPGLACITAHAHSPEFKWQRNFQVRGDLVADDGGWALVPRRLVGGFEVAASQLQTYRENFRKVLRFRRTAKRELARRGR